MTEIEQKQQFARDSYKAIRNILYKEHGIDNDNLARYMTLQVLQETEWGKKPSGKNNQCLLIKHNILSSNLEKELTNPNEEKRKLAKEIYNGLTDHLYSRVEKIT